MKQTRDTLFINDLIIPCVIGTFDAERTEKQSVTLTIALVVDTTKAAETDNLEDAVDYYKIYQKIVSFVSNSQYQLLEALASAVAQLCLEDANVQQVKVHIEKPQALPLAKSSAIEVTRTNTTI